MTDVTRWPMVAVVGLAALSLVGCGEKSEPPTAAQREQALAAGYDVELVYVVELDGYSVTAGGSGVYGDDGYQQIYWSARSGSDLRLTVERRSIDATSCPDLPIPAAEPADAAVTCTEEADGWMRVAGDRHEFAVARDDLLVRASAPAASTSDDLVRSAALQAHPASAADLASDPAADQPDVVERGDITGDNAPNNDVGAGG